ncbi:hypothetical protein Tco_1077448 [Tanacetum coccineum]
MQQVPKTSLWALGHSQDNINEGGNRNLAGAKRREHQPLDEQFDLLELQEYGTNSEDEYEKATSEDYEYHDSHAMKLNDTSPQCIHYAEQFENENENDKEAVSLEESSDESEDVSLEESNDESEGWDYETIITNSNLDNHPGRLKPREEGKKRSSINQNNKLKTNTLIKYMAFPSKKKGFFSFLQIQLLPDLDLEKTPQLDEFVADNQEEGFRGHEDNGVLLQKNTETTSYLINA